MITTMESLSHKVPTYFVYEQHEGKNVGEIIGPIFPDEVQEVKLEVFQNRDVKVEQECIFKAFYYDQYKETFREYWVDFIAALLDSLSIPFDYEIDTTEVFDIDDEVEDSIQSWDGDEDDEDYDLEDSDFDIDDEDDDEYRAFTHTILSEYFSINKDINGTNKLFVSFNIELSPYWVGIIVKELTLYTDGIFELEMGDPYYMTRKGEIVVGDDAFLKRVQETIKIHDN